MPTDPISYQLAIRLEKPVRCVIGKLGTVEFPAGDYLYTGSATRGLEARIARHLSHSKTCHWHIDYLSAAPGFRITSVLRSALGECRLNQEAAGRTLIRGFGATDCRAGCGSHLKFLG